MSVSLLHGPQQSIAGCRTHDIYGRSARTLRASTTNVHSRRRIWLSVLSTSPKETRVRYAFKCKANGLPYTVCALEATNKIRLSRYVIKEDELETTFCKKRSLKSISYSSNEYFTQTKIRYVELMSLFIYKYIKE